jgi:hypothetical protein
MPFQRPEQDLNTGVQFTVLRRIFGPKKEEVIAG